MGLPLAEVRNDVLTLLLLGAGYTLLGVAVGRLYAQGWFRRGKSAMKAVK
ncbi:MAG: hypothetical protein XXXJIFNMEKO3_00143 [Candidatus Erwinia impunctatus]|nr:hypothetical protein XXXJIFNMEKO_00143 [Culicoides impunctatus]